MRDALREGVSLYNHGEYFEAHEVWEAAWVKAPGVERFFLQALIHAAVAKHHAGNENAEGASRQLDKALRKLAGYLPERAGLDTAEFWRELIAWREEGQPFKSAKAAAISFCASGPTGVSGKRTGPP